MRALVIALGLTVVQIASAQQSAPPQDSPNTPRFRVAADGVRIDAVVTDGDGRVVADLTADDFEVRQDGKPQKLLFAQFVPVLTGPAVAAASPRASAAISEAPPAAVPQITRDNVQRTLAIVVDDLSLSFESVGVRTTRTAHLRRPRTPAERPCRARANRWNRSARCKPSLSIGACCTRPSIGWNGTGSHATGSSRTILVNMFQTFDNRSGLGDLN
jgi:hypothetical protein